MTSPSLRKLRITQPNILRWTAFRCVQAVLLGAILTSELLPVDSAQAQITDDTESRQKNTPSLESLKKRSAATRWKSIKDSSKSNLWKSVPSTVKKSSETLSEDQRIFEEPKPMLPDQSIVDVPQNASSRSDVDPTKEQPLPVFNLTEDPVRRQETFTLPNKLQKPQPAPYCGNRKPHQAPNSV